MTLPLVSKLQALIIGVVAVLIAGFAFLPSIASAAEPADAQGGAEVVTPAVPYVPTVIKPGNGYQTLESKPLITGVTLNDTRVAVYIDGQFNGYASVVNSDSGTASWSYYPFLDLAPGAHTLQTRAENPESGLRSEASVKTWFEVIEPTPAPILLEAVVNEDTTWDKPWITGVSFEGLEVAVYIDGKFNGYAELGNDKVEEEEMVAAAGLSDTREVMSFKYQPFLHLDEGWHTAYATARDKSGKVSAASALISFYVNDPATVPVTVATEETATDNETETTTEEDTTPDVGGPIVEDTSDDSSDDTDEDTDASDDTDEDSDDETEVYIEDADDEDEDSEAASSDDEDDEEADEEGTSRSTIIGWIILALVAIGLVYKGRKGMKSFFNEPELTSMDSGSKDDSAKLTSDKKEGDSKNKGDKDSNIPPPPPPASSF